jgi:hypothetical protein
MDWESELKKKARVALYVAIAEIVSLAVYVAFEEVFRATHKAFVGLAPFSDVRTIRYVFYGLAVLQVIFLRLVRGLVLRKSASESPVSLIRKLFWASLITSALSEVPAILGLILFLLAGLNLDFYALTFVSLILIFMFFPRGAQWSDWIQERASSSCLPCR